MQLTQAYEFWFAIGSQPLYGQAVLDQVAQDGQTMADKLNASGLLPYPVKFKQVVTTADNITAFMQEANYRPEVAGVITWMHTFSPAKNWIRGTQLLQKPLLHLATQFGEDIPYASIDFDYMNLNQSAHGDREYGYINARLNKRNKVVYGYWKDPAVQQAIAAWQDVAVAYNESFHTRVARFGDNMRNVAVTDGDRVEAQIKLGWTVDYYGVGDLVALVNAVSEADIDAVYADLEKRYVIASENLASIRYQLREYLALREFLTVNNYQAFTTNFEDLWGLEQLPGLAAQLLMRDGFGFAGEGDWKTAALLRVLKVMTHNKQTAFMEDYTLDLRSGHEAILGSHMLEVDPTIASDRPRVEVHPLDIGGKADPARLVFTGSVGPAIDITLSDFRDGFKLIGYAVDAKKPEADTPHLPVAKQLWTPQPRLAQGATAWIQAGGGHHTVFSFAASQQQVADLATMYGITLNWLG